MRISTNPSDAGFKAFTELTKKNKTAAIFYNGVELKHVITADDETGFIEMFQVDQSGKFVRKDDDEFERVTLEGGRVSIHEREWRV